MLELLIIVVYIWKIDTKVRLFDINLFRAIFLPENRKIWGAFFKVAFPIMCSGMIWAISVPMQTAILGHLSADAIAANSVSSTFFQYLKVIVIAISSASAVVIGKDIGEGDIERVKSDGRTLSVIDVLIGIVLASLLFVLRGPLLSMYKLTDTAAVLRAAEIDADVILLAKNVDGVYSADPVKDPTAVKYDSISYDEVLAQHLMVMDTTATSLSMDNHIPVLLFALKDPENIIRALCGENVGTIVKE